MLANNEFNVGDLHFSVSSMWKRVAGRVRASWVEASAACLRRALLSFNNIYDKFLIYKMETADAV
jgi:hypothetical protein